MLPAGNAGLAGVRICNSPRESNSVNQARGGREDGLGNRSERRRRGYEAEWVCWQNPPRYLRLPPLDLALAGKKTGQGAKNTRSLRISKRCAELARAQHPQYFFSR